MPGSQLLVSRDMPLVAATAEELLELEWGLASPLACSHSQADDSVARAFTAPALQSLGRVCTCVCPAGEYSLLLSHPAQRLVAVMLVELFCQQVSTAHILTGRGGVAVTAGSLLFSCARPSCHQQESHR